ncbi:hypothetical protein C1878_14840 [Gordonibacter sp. 28C]|nr:hypothetical protein C1878_14840 [Gordonibacter sp. 28C]
MTKIDDIYDAVDDFGLITSAEAKGLGDAPRVYNAERAARNHEGARGMKKRPSSMRQFASSPFLFRGHMPRFFVGSNRNR